MSWLWMFVSWYISNDVLLDASSLRYRQILGSDYSEETKIKYSGSLWY